MKKKFENIVIASDIDGTFLGSGSRMIPRNLDKIQYFKDNGGHFTFATGRLPIFMRKSLPNAKEITNMPAITGNGTCLYDFQNERSIEDIFLTPELGMELIRFSKTLADGIGFRGCVSDGFVISDVNNIYQRREYEIFPNFMNKRILPFDEWNTLDVYKINIMHDEDTLKYMYPILREKFADKMTVSRAGFYAIEVMPFATGKAKMLRRAVDERFGDGVVLCTVGDYDNDLEMHSIADIAVCPQNANDAVKNVCKLCLCDHNDGVVADLIDYLDCKITEGLQI